MSAAVSLTALRQLGCAVDPSDAPAEPAPAGADPSASMNRAAFVKGNFECAEVPTAWVLGGDTDAPGLGEALRSAGFSVAALPLDQSPIDLTGLIVIPSFATDQLEYTAYIQQYAEDLRGFVDNANVLLELPQRAEIEPTPPFVPAGYGVRREQRQAGDVRILSADNALTRPLPSDAGNLDWHEPDAGSPAFAGAESFELLLAGKDDCALLIEAAYGQGRFVLSALAFDQPSTDAQAAIATALFGTLPGYVNSVCARTAGAVRLKAPKRQTAFTEGSSMLAVLPDTQYYSLRFPGLFHAQTSWIRENAGPRDLKYVLHLGDIVNNNTQVEWERASAAMSQLHGVVPYALAPGNHDYGPSGNAKTRDTLLNDNFSFGFSADMPSFGGTYQTDALDNTYHLFSIQGRNFIVMALEWAPRDEVVAWADEVMSQHPDREGILITHAYLYHDDLRYDGQDPRPQRYSPYGYPTPGSNNDGEMLWQKLVRKHRFAMTMNGHVLGDGCGYLASVTDQGNVCHQMLSNYQMRAQGGEAYMRLLEFLPDGRTVQVYTYSPLYDGFLDIPGHNYTITLT